jgi:hypothetical protein
MSFKDVEWAYGIKTGSATTKSVLVAMAGAVGKDSKDSCVWPSVAHLCQQTELNRKTVMSAQAKLEAMGLIEKTGSFVGKTKQIPVYRVNCKQSQNRDSSETGTVPVFPANSPVFSAKQSQKRDTESVMESVKESVKHIGLRPSLPGWVPVDLWKMYRDNCDDIGKPRTPHGEQMALNKLAELREAGYDPTEVIEQAIQHGSYMMMPVRPPF